MTSTTTPGTDSSDHRHALHRALGTSDDAPGTAGGPAQGSAQTSAQGVITFRAPEIVFGIGSLAEAGSAARRLGARHPFVVTDDGLLSTHWVPELLGHLADTDLRPTVWSDVTPNPKDHEVAAGVECYRHSGCDLIVALGGGSCMDAAKAIAILSSNGGRIVDYAGVDKVTRAVPLLMIPTTAGTGADVSQFCVITDTADAVKVTIMGRALVPDISLTDPRLLATMPDELAAASGLDALTHGIEAFVSRAHNPLTDAHALNAVRLVFANLPQMIRRRTDHHRENMAQASLEAGLAFSNAILGATHAMSHQVGGLLDLPHGVINGVLLPHVIRFNAAAAAERFVALAGTAGVGLIDLPADVAGDLFAGRVRDIGDELGIPRGLGELGVTADDIPMLARNAMADACLTTNPRATSESDVAALFRAAL